MIFTEAGWPLYRQPQIINRIFSPVHFGLTTCEELSRNASGRNDYHNILRRPHFENMVVCGVHL